jgi:hypothetical protein
MAISRLLSTIMTFVIILACLRFLQVRATELRIRLRLIDTDRDKSLDDTLIGHNRHPSFSLGTPSGQGGGSAYLLQCVTATHSLEMLDELHTGIVGRLFCLALGSEREQRRHPMNQLPAVNGENREGGGPFPFCYFLRDRLQQKVPVTELDGLWIGCVQLNHSAIYAPPTAAMISWGPAGLQRYAAGLAGLTVFRSRTMNRVGTVGP